MPEEKSFLGRGWSFPPNFNIENKGVEMVKEREDIDQSLGILLSTSLGERVLQPEYGCNLSDYQFEAINAALIGFIKDLVENAILYYEPRIKLDKVEVSEAESLEGVLQISVDYFIRETNSRFNFVYDFYLTEGATQP